MANGPVPRTLTRAQQARRQRVVDAAMSLALDGGYEAVQMRDVAARADVAMGTVYRYFTSKDHLLAAALVHWVEQLDSRLAQLLHPVDQRSSQQVVLAGEVPVDGAHGHVRPGRHVAHLHGFVAPVQRE